MSKPQIDLYYTTARCALLIREYLQANGIEDTLNWLTALKGRFPEVDSMVEEVLQIGLLYRLVDIDFHTEKIEFVFNLTNGEKVAINQRLSLSLTAMLSEPHDFPVIRFR